MNKITLFLVFINITISMSAMEMQPPQFLMKKNDNQIKKLITSKEFSCASCDCLDYFKWAEFLLQMHPVPKKPHPLIRNNDVSCCGEGFDITMKSCVSSSLLCVPQCCLFGMLRMLLELGKNCYSAESETLTIVSLSATAGVSAYVTLRNADMKEKKD